MKNKKTNTDAPAVPAQPASQPASPQKTLIDILNCLPFLCYQFTLKDKAEKLAQLKADYPKFTERLIKKYASI